MGNFNEIDLFITQDGDLAINKSGDLAIVRDINYVAQTIINRLKSIDQDWFFDNIGSNLESFIGNPNTEENANIITETIIDSLISDNFCDIDDILITASPTAANAVTIGIFVKTEFDDNPISFVLELDYLNDFEIRRLK